MNQGDITIYQRILGYFHRQLKTFPTFSRGAERLADLVSDSYDEWECWSSKGGVSGFWGHNTIPVPGFRLIKEFLFPPLEDGLKRLAKRLNPVGHCSKY